ncbi:archease [Candidatus Micrarchaeota archaeon]|nr:archease [Candidatus Micrarchaeota archaeon]MBI5177526.1 archease [Candidatus Micrarchaeota archaeon]
MEKFILRNGEGAIELEAFGFSFESALSHAGLGLMNSLSHDYHAVRTDATVVLEEKAETIEELANLLLCDLLTESGEKDLLFKEISVEQFRKTPDGNYYALLVARGGALEGAEENALVNRISVAAGGVKESEKGSWSIKARMEV